MPKKTGRHKCAYFTFFIGAVAAPAIPGSRGIPPHPWTYKRTALALAFAGARNVARQWAARYFGIIKVTLDTCPVHYAHRYTGSHGFTYRLFYCLLPCLIMLGAAPVFASQENVSLLVDTRELSLSVLQDKEVVQVFDNIAIGSNGATWNKQQGDEKTPLGDFRITEVRPSDRFVSFIAIDYPNLDHARRALQEQRITAETFTAVKTALDRGRPPPQQTRLGGHIGIHGLGSGDAEVHQLFNWTNGCVALTNEQLAELLPWLAPGMRVLIR